VRVVKACHFWDWVVVAGCIGRVSMVWVWMMRMKDKVLVSASGWSGSRMC
jgi:hypothetical protein